MMPHSSSASHPRREDGYFHTRSPLGASKNPNPMFLLASNIIAQVFGPTVQTVADCLIYHFPSSDDAVDAGATLSDITSCIIAVCSQSGSRTNHKLDQSADLISQRDKILNNIRRKNPSSSWSWNRTKGSDEKGFIFDEFVIRSALLLLIHYSLVQVREIRRGLAKASTHTHKSSFKYAIDIQRILYIPRYAKWVDWTRTKVFANANNNTDTTRVSLNIIGALLVETLCVHGRMLSLQLLLSCRSLLDAKAPQKETPQDKQSFPDKETTLKDLIEVFKQLVSQGFIELAPTIEETKDSEEKEFDLNSNDASTVAERLSGQKRTFTDIKDQNKNAQMDREHSSPYLSKILEITQKSMNKKYFPPGAVWRINADMFNQHMRSHYIGRLVHERFGDRVASAGHFVTCALKYVAHRMHSPTFPLEVKRHGIANIEANIFSPEDILEYISPQIVSSLQSKPGGARIQLSMALVSLCRMSNPPIAIEVESAEGHPKGGMFEIRLHCIVDFMKRMIARQMVRDHYGEIPARITSILESTGYAESEFIAEAAMIPSKDAREALHRLYKANYIDLMGLQNTKQHNPGTAIYLWGVQQNVLQTNVLQNVCQAFYNIRLRQQHEIHLGRELLERADETSTADENEVEIDKIRRDKFLNGLERLDQACIQLDETLMALTSF